MISEASLADRGMIERLAWEVTEYVARRPWRLLASDRADLLGKADVDRSYDVAEPTRYDLLEASRAVLIAMRHPTDAMLASGAAALNVDAPIMELAWRAMIDAALAEPPPEAAPSSPCETIPEPCHILMAVKR